MAIFCVVLTALASLAALILQGCGGGGNEAASTTMTTTNSLPASTPEYDASIWKALVSGAACPAQTVLTPKNPVSGGMITCSISNGVRHFKFPPGMFDIDIQVEVPANTEIEGNASPIAQESDKTKGLDPSMQTFFVATHGVTDNSTAYCGTGGNMQPGDAQRLRIGFLLNSNTAVRNLNFQGRDTTRPLDNGNLCGGGVFETPGCVSPGFGDGPGTHWTDKRVGCYDHTGQPNTLITGDGKGVENVTIDSVRLNSLFLPPSPAGYVGGMGSQVAVWVAMTQDGSPTKRVHVTNLVSMLTRADGVNFHGDVQDSLVEGCHIENTGDDVYAYWGAYAKNPSGTLFRNNVGKNPGATRAYMYGVCVAIYGAREVKVTGTKCYDLAQTDWNPGQVPKGDSACKNGPNCNSCLAYVHDGWFGAVYPENANTITLEGNSYFYMNEPAKPIPNTDRPLVRSDAGSHANIVVLPGTDASQVSV